MDRRRYLALLATGLAGCSANPGTGGLGTPTLTPAPEPTDTPETSETPETTPPETTETPDGPLGRKFGSLVDLRTAGKTYALLSRRYHSRDGGGVRFEFTATATVDHPAFVRATLTNASPWANTFRLREIPPFGRFFADPPGMHERDLTYRSGLVLAPTENHELTEVPAEYELAEDGHWRLTTDPGAWVSEFPETLRLEADESVTGEYAVVGHAEGVGKGRPNGHYRFEWVDDGLTVSVWDTAAPGPDAGSRFTVTPNNPPDGEKLRWYHNADEETGLFLQPSVETTDLPAKVEFTLYNHTHSPLGGNRYDWVLYKWQGGEWYRIAPYAVPVPYTMVPPGGKESWSLAAFAGKGFPVDDAIEQGYLGGGTYAFRVNLSREGEGPMPAALLELDAPAVEVTAPPERTLQRSGATVTVTTPRWKDGKHPASARLTVERRGEPRPGPEVPVTRLVPEQVMRRPYDTLRDVFPYFEDGVERVVLRTDRHAVGDVVGYEFGVRWFVFEGTAYRAEARVLEETTPEPGPETRTAN